MERAARFSWQLCRSSARSRPYTEGLVHGFLVLRTLEDETLAHGDLIQIARDGRVTAHLIFHFKDGSLYDETAVYSQHRSSRLLRDHLVKKGPSFPHPEDLSIDAPSGQVTVRYVGDDGTAQVKPFFKLSQARATRCAGVLLFILAGIVAFSSVGALILRVEPDTSWVGIGITVAVLLAMPILSWRKRRVGHTTKNAALLADAVQSATCAYLAGITLCGLAINAIFHVRWIDPLAALIVIPIICIEARRALRGDACQCC